MADSQYIRVLLVRTGATAWEESGRLIGRSDLPLSERGRAQIEAEAADLNGTSFVNVFCSPDEASVQTAKVLADRAGGKTKKIEALSGQDLGLWEGMRLAELEDKCPRAYRQWREDPHGVNVPNGESLGDVEERVVRGLRRLLEKIKPNGRAVAIVVRPEVHGLVRCWLDGIPTGRAWTVAQDGPGMVWRTIERESLRMQEARAGG